LFKPIKVQYVSKVETVKITLVGTMLCASKTSMHFSACFCDHRLNQ